MGVAQWEVEHGLSWNTAAIATGEYFADALTGSALLGHKLGPILLVHQKTDPTVTLLTEKAEAVDTCYVLGGLISVPEALASPYLYLGQPEPTTTVVQPTPQPQPDTTQTQVQTTEGSSTQQQTSSGTSSTQQQQTTEQEGYPRMGVAYDKNLNTIPCLCIGRNKTSGIEVPDENETVPYAYNKTSKILHSWACYYVTRGDHDDSNWEDLYDTRANLLSTIPNLKLCSRCMHPEDI